MGDVPEVVEARRRARASVRDIEDDQLVAAFQHERDKQAVNELLRRHEGLIMSVARRYFVPGGDHDDVRQQAMIGFWKAVRDYTADAGASFPSFARTCMQRQVITAVKAANRMKHSPLNESDRIAHHDAEHDEDQRSTSVQLPAVSHEGSVVERMDMDGSGGMPFGLSEIEGLLEAHGHDAVHELLRAHFEGKSTRRRKDEPDRLSENEAHVLVGLLSGKKYREIAEQLGKTDKFVDNTVQRLRAKLRHLLEG
ncbi:MAG TPA: sigma-70 family RNA polymerase sigma factor [Acidimicrobiales bacterium]|nr:sigma-70 family RNA polymerase sigma factor [Acidimicrobiales bacterium]